MELKTLARLNTDRASKKSSKENKSNVAIDPKSLVSQNKRRRRNYIIGLSHDYYGPSIKGSGSADVAGG
jgi:hypothetical protein